MSSDDSKVAASYARLKKLSKHLKSMSMDAIICAGHNKLASKRTVDEKIWLTHTAAIRRHAASAKSHQPCLILEDDVEFVVDADTLDKKIRTMFAHRPDYSAIVLGAIPVGFTVLIGGGLAVSQSPILAHSVIYSPQFSQWFLRENKLLAHPDYGESWDSLPFHDRLISSDLLSTQNVWPREAQFMQIKDKKFKQFHLDMSQLSMYGAPITVALAIATIVCGVILLSYHIYPERVCKSIIYAGCGVGVAVLLIVASMPIFTHTKPLANLARREELRQIIQDEKFIEDFAPNWTFFTHTFV